MNTNKLTAEQQGREERANQKRAAINVLCDVIAVYNNFYSTSSDVVIYADTESTDITITGHNVTDFIAVAKLMGLRGYASAYNEVTIY